jgi:hypothetical protein
LVQSIIDYRTLRDGEVSAELSGLISMGDDGKLEFDKIPVNLSDSGGYLRAL